MARRPDEIVAGLEAALERRMREAVMGLSSPVRLRMQAEYIVGHWGKNGTSYAKLSRKYGVPLSTVERWAARDGWYRQRREVWQRVNAVRCR